MYPFLMYSMVVDWVMHNTGVTITEANRYAYDCLYDYGNPEIGMSFLYLNAHEEHGWFPPLSEVNQRAVLGLLHILASDQVHRVAEIPYRQQENMTMWIAYNPLTGVIVAYVAAYKLFHGDIWRATTYAGRVADRFESRILNRLIGMSMTIADIFDNFIYLSVGLRKGFRLEVTSNAPTTINGVVYHCNSFTGLSEHVFDFLPMILDSVGWTLAEDQNLTADEIIYQRNAYTTVPARTYRCDQGVLSFVRRADIRYRSIYTIDIWGPVRSGPPEVIEV